MKMHRRTTKRGTYSNWNSEEGKAKIKQSVQKWFAEFNGTMSLIDYAKKEGIPVTTLRQYCHNDVTKRKSVDDIKERKLIKAHERDRFIKLVGNKSTSSALRIIQEHYKLTHSQATQQYYRYAREAREEQPGQQRPRRKSPKKSSSQRGGQEEKSDDREEMVKIKKSDYDKLQARVDDAETTCKRILELKNELAEKYKGKNKELKEKNEKLTARVDKLQRKLGKERNGTK